MSEPKSAIGDGKIVMIVETVFVKHALLSCAESVSEVFSPPCGKEMLVPYPTDIPFTNHSMLSPFAAIEKEELASGQIAVSPRIG